ncbi:DUF3017 domain-containing protein [Arsenicicoccus piscis]|uniref:DUF3017 domain-containing protein n=1 Tax=Arsenicicoccus piscis TaxID=673954 RepID=A0ABQ6HPZ6_9MICO|nr:DUF3017 domain-containing protein [Arsenicicoccus piscis]MCH8628167.1 DUF3017 domain-containing protein [Arsenicicoccus piscis]MCH8629383.1 DUF3017 domain-containing protein [Arsenicicoccus piscis]GMA20451.1 hypothetical protein GCM10025862_24720 [Arsenicicoccus piscis]
MQHPSIAQTRLGAWWVLGAGLAIALVTMLTGQLRSGGYVFAAALLLAGALRTVLPREAAAGLVIRPRWLDLVLYVGAGTAVLVATFLLKIPQA